MCLQFQDTSVMCYTVIPYSVLLYYEAYSFLRKQIEQNEHDLGGHPDVCLTQTVHD